MKQQRQSLGSNIFENQQNIQEEQVNNTDELMQKSQSVRYKKCQECEEYYQVIVDQKTNHSCIDALKKRISDQQNQISCMLTKEEVAEILKGYIPLDTFLNFVKNTEKKFSELFHNVNTHQDIIKGSIKLNKKQDIQIGSIQKDKMQCPEGHNLYKLTGARLRNITCDICSELATEQGKHTARCELCNFDICAICEDNLKKIKCTKGHSLRVVRQEDYFDLECDKCAQDISNISEGSFRCEICDYDLCGICFKDEIKESQTKKK